MVAEIDTMGTEVSRPKRLPYMPVTFFAIVMGLGGTSLAWLRAATFLGAPPIVGIVLFWVSLGVFVAVAVAYAAKTILHFTAVQAELRHPIRLAFVPTASISLLILATASLEIAPNLSAALWWVGMILQFALTLFVMSSWLTHPTFAMGHVTPAWFIPTVGMVVVPLAGVSHGPVELSWFAFSAGVLFWLGLLPVVLNRLFLHEQPVPPMLLPTLAVLVAPPAVAFLALQRLHGSELTDTVRMLFYAALFFFVLLVLQFGRLRRLPFFLSWWAYTFPLAAFSVATTVMTQYFETSAFDAAAWAGLVLVTALVLLIAFRTIAAMARGKICVPE